MKKMKIVAALAAFFSVIGFSSCIDSDNASYDVYDYVTVVQDSWGRNCLVGDFSNLTFQPVNSTVLAPLQLSDGGYYKRAYVGIKLAEEYVDGKTEYNVSEIAVSYAIPYMDFNLAKDTLKGDYALTNLNKAWAKAGFVNVDFGVNVESANTASFYNDIHMYVTKASADTLYTKLRYVKPTEMGQDYSVFVSFGLPKYAHEYYQLAPKNDSIVIKVEADGKMNEELKAFAKYRYDELPR